MTSHRPIKVVQVIARMNIGGPAVLVADLMRSFDSQKVDSVLITGFCDIDESDYLNEVATDVVAIRLPGLGRSISPLKDIYAFFLLLIEIRKFKPDIIHTHTAKAGVLGRLAGLIAAPRAKRVHTFHGHLLHGYFGLGKTQFVVFVEKFLALFTVRLIAIGNNVKKDLLEAGVGKEAKYEIIFPGLQSLQIYPKQQARQLLRLENSKTYLVFVGRLTQIKRPDRLLDIARFLKVNYQDAELIIAGAGELLATIKNVCDSEDLPMIFLGWRNDIDLILSAADIAILCSDNEGIPLTLIQAAQAGLPIISTDVGSVTDIVTQGINGLLTETTSSALISATKSLLDDPSLRDCFGIEGKKKAQDYFTLEGMVTHHERLYSQIT
jgi:glycosyltransferase involved in cell wall biosynthesis